MAAACRDERRAAHAPQHVQGDDDRLGDVYGGGAPTGIVFNEGDGLGKKYRGLLLSAEAAEACILEDFPAMARACVRQAPP